MERDGHSVAHLVRAWTDLLLEPYLPRRRAACEARDGTVADGSGIQDKGREEGELRAEGGVGVGEERAPAGSDRSPAEGYSRTKCWRIDLPLARCTG